MRRQKDIRDLPAGRPGGEAEAARRGGDEGSASLPVPGVSKVAHRKPRQDGGEKAGRSWESIHASRPWGQYPNEHIVRAVLRQYGDRAVRSRVVFLDVGAGGGAHTWFLAREGFRVRAVDISPSAIRRIREQAMQSGFNALVTAQEGCIAHLTFSAVQFDCAIDCCTLQHLGLDEAYLAVGKIWSALRPGGTMVSLMASDEVGDWSGAGPIQPRPASLADVGMLFGPFGIVQVGSELQKRPDGTKVAHWIIWATK